MSYFVGHDLAVVGAPGDVHTSQRNPLGMRAFDNLGNELIYLAGVASTILGSWVNFDVAADFTTQLLDTDVAGTQLGRIAVASAAIVASSYGWYYIYGDNITGSTLSSATDTKNAFATSTAGSVDDSGAGAEVLVFGAFYKSAESSNLATFSLNYPFMIGITLD